MSMLFGLDPRPIQSMPMEGYSAPSAPPVQPAPMVPQQQMQRANFGQNFRQNLGPILQALGYGIASNDLSRGAAMIGPLADRRREQAMQQQQMAQEQQQLNATKEWLKAKGREDLVPLVDAGQANAALRMATEQSQGADMPASVQEYEYAKRNGFEGSFMDYQAGKQRSGAGVQYGTTPQWYEMEDGSQAFGVLGSDGSFKPVELPPGAKPLNPEGVAAAKARGAAAGKVQGGAQAQLGGASLAAQESIRLVDAALADPALPSAVGPIDSRLPGFVQAMRPGVANFNERIEQLKGKAFLTARAELKGGGQITDYEGQRAEAALLRASLAKSEDEFRAALLEFKDAIVRGYQILEQQAGVGGGAGGAPAGAEDPLGLR